MNTSSKSQGRRLRSASPHRGLSSAAQAVMVLGALAGTAAGLTVALSTDGVRAQDRDQASNQASERLTVVTTFTILQDMARHIAGDEMDVRVLSPVGAEVHDYELTPGDFAALEDADIVFYNGHMLEQWMDQVEATVSGSAPLVAVAELVDRPTLPIAAGDYEGATDPHLWMDPEAASAYVEVMTSALGDLFPESATVFRANADAYLAEIDTAADEARTLLAEIPPDQRLLITTEAAFQYFADHHGWRHFGVWGSNAETAGAPSQLLRMIDLVSAEQPAALFFESTVSDRHVAAISEDTGVPTAGPLFVDSLGGPGSGVETYPDLLRVNARTISRTIVEALASR